MDCLDEETVVAFVNGALRGPALAAVERHLVDCPACATLVAVAAPPTGAAHPGSPAPELSVGRYRLLRLVGRGGMGEVYAAHDPELDRKVAIKILRADARPDNIEAARLAREAQAVARLSHPNVVAIHDVGSSAGRMFLAMELVEGETLAVWLARQTRTPSEILNMFLMAGRGLAAAHKAGIVHRDFKPQNVMVARDGSARVMDFGLAAAGGPGAAGQARLTKAGAILGTPLYMSPEQMVGQPVDPRADQFSFCVALWEALHGGRPFAGTTLLELRGDVLAGKPRPGPLRGRVPRRVQMALLRGLSVDRDRRFADMDTLLTELGAAPARTSARTAAAGVTIGLGLAALVGGAVLWRLHARAVAACDPAPKLANVWEAAPDGLVRHQTRIAFLAAAGDVPDARQRFERVGRLLDGYVQSWGNAARETCETATRAPDGVTGLRAACLERRRDELGALTEVLAHADAKVVRRAVAAVSSLGRVDGCADLVALRAAPLPPADAALRARVEQLTGRLLALRAAAEAGHDWPSLDPAAALVEDVRAAGYEPLLIEALLVDARIRSPFDPEGAIPLYEEAHRRAGALHLDDFAAEAAIQLTAIVGTIQHRFADGEKWAGLAEAALGHAGEHERLRGWLENVRGALEAGEGKWRQAESDFAASASHREQVLGPVHPDLAASLANLSKAALMLDDADQALDAAARAAKLASGIFPADAYEVNAALLARAHALVALRRAPEARADVTAVEAAFEKLLGRDHPFLAEPMTVLGEVALAEGRPADARAVLERAWEIRSTHVTDAGAREETAFALARAIWESAPADRTHALELANEAHDGYAAIPDLAPRLATVGRWIEERADAHAPRRAVAEPP
ncbi:MAG TPA: serine/threonine-protein kinase [Polyangia bacterium]|nr:serine/threonine-protein kinase [Polyangia bacterium]